MAAVLSAANLDDAVDLVNDSRYGLAAGICTRGLAAAHCFAAAVRVGVVRVSRPATGLDLNVPLGGVGDSSSNTFRERGAVAVDFSTWSTSASSWLGEPAKRGPLDVSRPPAWISWCSFEAAGVDDPSGSR
ncbi:aldehyde dehydrogenase family protein (plasmid) [Streptomyces sp. CA-142005]|uniref:aldehyde dehydrogenase family protein n=1 Tax=Streptomyces sp. CA-142005 TaxID=3240052 RepID=UPI003D91667E